MRSNPSASGDLPTSDTGGAAAAASAMADKAKQHISAVGSQVQVQVQGFAGHPVLPVVCRAFENWRGPEISPWSYREPNPLEQKRNWLKAELDGSPDLNCVLMMCFVWLKGLGTHDCITMQ